MNEILFDKRYHLKKINKLKIGILEKIQKRSALVKRDRFTRLLWVNYFRKTNQCISLMRRLVI